MKTVVMCCVLCLLMASAASNSHFWKAVSHRQMERRKECKVKQRCMWAVCPWSRRMVVSLHKCQFIATSCQCPEDMKCVRSPTMKPYPGDSVLYTYRCHHNHHHRHHSNGK
ncbi:uncharacterized protein LOC143302125 isoform X2 [Babylonia areolata]|uniref:uncharacterized protein LOC143302125 isoform X2 n=1 Tax=Babylonia areolata TaxID=304850 RepID=UPI003FD2FAB7